MHDMLSESDGALDVADVGLLDECAFPWSQSQLKFASPGARGIDVDDLVASPQVLGCGIAADEADAAGQVRSHVDL
jgi:hypothetical protein